MRTRTIIIVIAAMQVLLGVAVVSASAATPHHKPDPTQGTVPAQLASAAKSVSGRLISTPSARASVSRLPVRVAVRLPSGTNQLLVQLGGRDISARFHSAGGSLRVAELTAGDGVRGGTNQLFVLVHRHGGRPVSDAATFFVGRPDDQIAHLRVRPGTETLVQAVLNGPAGRQRNVTMSLNGRQITRAASNPRPLLWTASLSPSQGLRPGRNQLRLRVVNPSTGGSEVVNRGFTVPRSPTMAAAGRDITARQGQRVYLNGYQSLAPEGGSLTYHWSVISEPEGTHVAIHDAGSERAYVEPIVRGRYVYKLETELRGVHFTASLGGQTSDTVTVTVGPADVLLPFKGLEVRNGDTGIEVGGEFYRNPSPDGKSMQWLTLDRTTMTPTKTGNDYFDGTAGGPHGLDALSAALAGEGLNQLVILAYPDTGSGQAVQPSVVDGFNKAMATIGVDPIDQGILTSHYKLAIVGIPFAGAGSGWSTHGGNPRGALNGWLMPDASQRYRYQPAHEEFDTSSKSTPTSNTMTVNGQNYTATLPAGTTGGFQVVWFNPIDLSADQQETYASEGPGATRLQIGRMAEDLDHWRGDVAVVQSIGHVQAFLPPHWTNAWALTADALARYGANPDTFNAVDGSYAFVGASELERSQDAQSSTAIVTDPTADPVQRQPGTLEGVMQTRSDGIWMPLTDASSPEDSLDHIALQLRTPWPLTETGPDPAAYDHALAYITDHLPDLKSWYPDLRNAYAGNDNLDYGHSLTDLTAMHYPDGNRACPSMSAGAIQSEGSGAGGDLGFSYEQFCALRKELLTEFHWLDNSRTLFNAYETVLGRGGSSSSVALDEIGEKIRASVEAPENAEVFTGSLAFIHTLAALGPATGPVGEVASVLAGAYELASAIANANNGAPLGERISAKAKDLSAQLTEQIVDTTGSLDRIRDVIISDYGRLKDLEAANLSVNVSGATEELTRGASGYFSSELLPLAYRVDWLAPSISRRDPTVDNCYIFFLGHSFVDAPKTAWTTWHAPIAEAPDSYSNLLALARRGGWSASDYAYPPPSLTNAMFGPINQHGYGLYLPQYMWTQYKLAPDSQVTCH